jgi:transcriptional regulator with XRE-family HTH domain
MWVEPRYYKAAGAILAVAREKAGISQQELAAKLSKPQSFVSAYERGSRRVDVLELLVIAEALDANPADIFKTIAQRFAIARRHTR